MYLYFLHIEKTAGTSFRTAIEKKFTPEEICPAYHQDEALSIAPEKLKKYKFFRGHYRLSVQQHITLDMPAALVMLREPVQRTISHLKHMQRARRQNELLREYLPINDLSVQELAEHPFIINYLREFQTKKLGLGFDPEGIDFPLRLFDPTIPYNKTLFLKAKKNLEKFFFIGITEYFEQSTQLLCNQLGWTYNKEDLLYMNKASPDEGVDLPGSLLQSLSMDFELYYMAVNLFKRRLKKSITL